MLRLQHYRAKEFRQLVSIALAMLLNWAGVGLAGHGTEDDVVTVTAGQVKYVSRRAGKARADRSAADR